MTSKSRILDTAALNAAAYKTAAVHHWFADDRKPGLAADARVQRDRLNRAAGRDPAAVLGVLAYWLAPQTGEGESRADH